MRKFENYNFMFKFLLNIEKKFDNHIDMINHLKKLGYSIYTSNVYEKIVELEHKTGTKYYFYTNFTRFDNKPVFSFCYRITKAGKKYY